MLTEIWQAELVPPCEPDCDAAYGPFPDQPPYGWWDVAWEEVFHLISHLGYGCSAPRPWSVVEGSGSRLTASLDENLGSCGFASNGTQSPRPPAPRDDCHYYYSDESCFYSCLGNEYLYQAYYTWLGAGDWQCSPSSGYDLCTTALMRARDAGAWALLDAPDAPTMPRVLPFGHYAPHAATGAKL